MSTRTRGDFIYNIKFIWKISNTLIYIGVYVKSRGFCLASPHNRRSKKPRIYKYHLKGHQLEAADTTKYLGVELSYNLSWNHHIDRTVKKGNSMLGFLKRNLKISNQDTKSAAYFSLVRPNLEYCASIWNPYSVQSIKKLEMVQRRAARYATSRTPAASPTC